MKNQPGWGLWGGLWDDRRLQIIVNLPFGQPSMEGLGDKRALQSELPLPLFGVNFPWTSRTPGFLELFRAHYNLKTRRWGRHKGTSAHEVLTGKKVGDWLTMLGYPPTSVSN